MFAVYNHGMKLMIASDLHGSAFYTKKLLERYDQENPDRLILLGDLLYHGPRNDLPKDYNPKEVIQYLNPLKEKILCVKGNCEAEVDQMVLDFPVMADYAVLFWNNRMMYLTHGHHWNTKTPPPLCRGDILLHGHTHIPAWETFGNDNLYLNPGSVSIPKQDSQHSYMILEDDTILWKNLDGDVCHSLNLDELPGKKLEDLYD